jgi:hypothetical protein
MLRTVGRLVIFHSFPFSYLIAYYTLCKRHSCISSLNSHSGRARLVFVTWLWI